MERRELPVFVWLPILLVAALLAGVAMLNRVAIQDWIYFRSYDPPREVVELADKASMSEEGERLFLRANPIIVSRDEVGSYCPGQHNLGCLVTGPQIYIAKDTTLDSQTDTNQQAVTAAHEMLHMAYFRLGNEDRDRIDNLVEAELQKPQNSDLAGDLNEYVDELERRDEAYARVGTEVLSISSELAKHYREFIKDRSSIVAAYEASN